MSAQVPPSTTPSKALQVQALGAAAPTAAMSMAQSNPQNAHAVPFMNNSFGGSNAAASGQTATAYSPPKTQFNQTYSHAVPTAQCLPATIQPVQPAAVPSLQLADKLIEEKCQSNGTTEKKDNHIASPPKNNTNISEKNDKVKPDHSIVLEPSEVPQVSVVNAMVSNTNMITVSTTSVTLEKVKEVTSEMCKKVGEESKGSKASNEKGQLEAKNLLKDSVANAPEKVHDKALDRASAMSSPSRVAALMSAETVVEADTREVKPKQLDAKTEQRDEIKETVATTEVPLLKSFDKPEEGKKADVDIPTEGLQRNPANTPSTPSTPVKSKDQPSVLVKSPMKVATTPRTPQRRSRTPKSEESQRSPSKTSSEPKPSTSKSISGNKTKRSRVRTQPYQSPLPELEIISKISQTITTPKSSESKLIVFFKNEFLAVRNSDGGFFVCQAVQNVYKSSSRIKIRWLSQDKSEKSGEIYTPDFYDFIDFECILTNLNLSKVDKSKFRLPAKEHDRTDNILKKAIAVEKGEAVALDDSMTEDNPDGLDVSLYTEEEQLTKRKGTKRKVSKGRPLVDKSVCEPQEKMQKKASRKKITPASAQKRGTASGRAERAKRRSAPDDTSPVIDNKKAKVLAKVVKRTATAASPKTTLKIKAKTDVKVTKQVAVASTSKAKVPKVSPARKAPKRGRK